MNHLHLDPAHHRLIERAEASLKRVRLHLILWSSLPIFTLPAGFAFVHYWEPAWYQDPLLLFILTLLVVGQLGGIFQGFRLWRGQKRVAEVLHVLKDKWPLGYDVLKAELEKLPEAAFRDSVLLWAEKARAKRGIHWEEILDRQAERRVTSVERLLGFHHSINRASLKIGFIGTLIGLLLTFEPMKDALITLQSDSGELGFISDIARAIDGDKYAILVTLFATAFSVIIETVQIQWLERILATFENANNAIEEWHVAIFRPELPHMELNEDKWDQIIGLLGNTVERLEGQMQRMEHLQNRSAQKVDALWQQEQEFTAFMRSRLGANRLDQES
jgi:hypothetical protein